MTLDFSSYKKEYDYLATTYEELLVLTLKHLSLKCSPIISVSIVSEKNIHEINRTYRNKDSVTDVISFAFLDNDPKRDELLHSKNEVDLGEIYICLNRAKKQAKDYNHSLERELDFLFVHGLLHLLGYDHMTKEDENIMFLLQEEILSIKGVKR